MLAMLVALQLVVLLSEGDPLAWLQPTVVATAEDRQQLERGAPIARVVPAKGLEVAVWAAVPVDIDGDRLVAWMRRIEALKQSSYVLAIGRFSDPPRIEDLASLALDDEDLSRVEDCRPGRCGLKLSSEEMTELQRATHAAGSDWKAALQQAFRRAVLKRVKTYLASGAVAPYEDESKSVSPADRFAVLLEHSTFVPARFPRLAEYLRGCPSAALSDVESFMYWSKERLARKPVISVTHVSIIRSREADLPDALVIGKEIFSTHYVNASLGVTALVRGAAEGPNYLVYFNRSEIDVLGGTFGGFVRWFLERRLTPEATTVLHGLRRRLEGGDPPD